MLDFLVSLGVATLSGMGVGSGGLLVVYLTMTERMGQVAAQGINLFFFLFASGASCAVNSRLRNIAWGPVGILGISGSAGAILGAFLASVLHPDVIRILFGAMLIITGVPALIRSLKAFSSHSKEESTKI